MLQQDVVVKQELLQKGKNEVTTLTAELEESTRQRDQLEKQKRETQAQIEEIDNQVTPFYLCISANPYALQCVAIQDGV